MTRLALVLAALGLMLAACTETTTVTRSGGSPLRPDAGGLAIEGSPQRVDFGRAEQGVVAAVTKLLDAPPLSRSVNAECGAGPTTTVRYDLIDLLFLNGAFQGWVSDDPRTVAANGLSPGVSRAQLEAGGYGPFEATTLGIEFQANGIFGLLPDNGAATPVQLLWAGTSCFFR